MESNQKRQAVLSHEQFFFLTEEIRNCRETIMSECHTYSMVKKTVVDRGNIKFPFSEYSVMSIVKMLGIVLPKRKKADSKRSSSVIRVRNNSREIIVKSIVALYEKLGEKIPKDLENLIKDLEIIKAEKQSAIPVNSIAKPETIRIS